MPTPTISASTIHVRSWDKPRKLSPQVALELSVAGLHCTCFDLAAAARLAAGDTEVTSDLLSTVIPAGLHWVKDPLGKTREAYSGEGLAPVLQESHSVATYFIDGFLPESQTKNLHNQTKDLGIADPCCEVDAGNGMPDTDLGTTNDKKISAPRWGGRTCSKLMFRADTPKVPLTFHLQLADVWEGHEPPAPGILAGGLDHFLLPSKTPGNTVVWLAIPRSDDPRENYDNLLKWQQDRHKFAAFDGVMYTSDALKISVVLDARPAG